ncbi:MAG: hypothetical protein ACPG5B_16380 [Chitinophagales bacterium]
MELDDFKKKWQQFSDKHIEQQHLNEAQLNVLLKKRVVSALKKLKKAFWLDVAIFASISIMLFIASFSTLHFIAKPLLFMLILLWLINLPIYIATYIKLHQFNDKKNKNIKQNLQSLVTRIKWSLSISQIAGILSPFVGIFGGYYAIHQTIYADTFWQLLGISSIIALLYFPFLRWYLNKNIGTYYEHLKACLHEFEDI